MRGLEPAANQALDRRLAPASRRPLAVALSGGGDSLALTLIADAWARTHGRSLVVLTVDHELQAESRAWTEACRATAARLGRPFLALSWTGAKPATGLPAAARAARHRLLADAARAADAEVILMGHTADDVAEAHAMRAAGSTTPDPREWGPSPAWPQGRGVFLLRPLLGVGRAAIRDWLRARGETWIEDPANADPRYARVRARLAGAGCGPPMALETPLVGAEADAFGVISLDRDAAPELLRMACVCAGGGERLPAGDRVARLAERLRAGERFTATLAGARIAAGETVRLGREPGEAGRGGLAAQALDRTLAWDGRFEVSATQPGLTVRRLAGLAARLSPQARRRLAAVPAVGRGGLPALVSAERVACPLLEDMPGITIRSLVAERLAAASGRVARERAEA